MTGQYEAKDKPIEYEIKAMRSEWVLSGRTDDEGCGKQRLGNGHRNSKRE